MAKQYKIRYCPWCGLEFEDRYEQMNPVCPNCGSEETIELEEE